MGKASRDKGARFEREVASDLRDAGVPALRGIGQSRSAGEVPDVDVEGWWIECKSRKSPPSLEATLRQAEDASQRSRLCLAIVKTTGKGIRCGIRLSDFCEALAIPGVEPPIDQWIVGLSYADALSLVARSVLVTMRQ